MYLLLIIGIYLPTTYSVSLTLCHNLIVVTMKKYVTISNLKKIFYQRHKN